MGEARTAQINANMGQWLALWLVDRNGKAEGYGKLFSGHCSWQFTFFRRHLDPKEDVVPGVKGTSNDACFDAMPMQPSHNQPCPIAYTLTGVDIVENHDRDTDFECHEGLGEATWQQRLLELIGDWVVLVVDGVAAIYWFKWLSLLFPTEILKDHVIDCQRCVVSSRKNGSLDEEIGGRRLQISVREDMIVEIFCLVETLPNLRWQRDGAVHAGVVGKVSKPLSVLTVEIPRQQLHVLRQVQVIGVFV